MCELDILHDSLYQFCPELHLKRLNSLTLACHALLDCKTLTLTELGRNLPTKARTKHNIKRIDRLLGNRHLHKERLAVYRWHASFICSGNTMPIVLVDWSDIREQKRLMVLRASVALHGRSVTLYEKAFPLSEQCSKKAHDQFLADLASILPSNTTPLIVSDAGFKVPWYKSVEKLGLHNNKGRLTRGCNPTSSKFISRNGYSVRSVNVISKSQIVTFLIEICFQVI